MLGMLSPASRGALMTAALFLFVFMGYVKLYYCRAKNILFVLLCRCINVTIFYYRMISGYYSARLYKTLKGLEWKKAAFQTATLYPGVCFGISFFLNFFIWGKHSSGAVRTFFHVFVYFMYYNERDSSSLLQW